MAEPIVQSTPTTSSTEGEGTTDITGMGDLVHEPCTEGTIWSEEEKKCVPISTAEDVKNPTLEGGGGVAEVTAALSGLEAIDTSKFAPPGTLVGRVERVVTEYLGTVEKRLTQFIDERLKTVLAQKDKDIETTLRKSFGLENDPVIRRSDLAVFARKAQLLGVETPKRAPTTKLAGKDGVGPEGNAKLAADADATASKKIDEIFKGY